LECNNYYNGRDWINFNSKEELHQWKQHRCDGQYTECPYFKTKVGEFEDVWLAVVSVAGQDYWRRVPDSHTLKEAIKDTIQTVISFDMIDSLLTSFETQIRIKVVHSADQGFSELLDDLKFSGCRLTDWTRYSLNVRRSH
jgi:hypothetical protein